MSTQQVKAEARALTTVIVGNSGSGKSSTSRGEYVEPLIRAKRRVVIIDPTGVWWGLRFAIDGKPGLPIAIVGGLYGDAPLAPGDAVSLADWIGAREEVAIIVDVSEMTIGERHEFATDFFAQLYKSNRRPLHLIVDEADEFAPQNPMPETKRMLHHFDRIVRRGRVRGFRPMMITQRPSVLHKNVMSQASALIGMRLLGSQDRAAVELWVKGQGDMAAGKEVLNTLARLQTGEGWLWIPGMDILNRGRFGMFTTFDSMRTPKDDEPPVEPPGPFPWHDEFAEQLAKVCYGEELEEREEVLRTVTEPDPARIVAAEKLGYEQGVKAGQAQGYRAATALLEGKVTGVLQAGEAFMQQLRDIGVVLEGGGNLPQFDATAVRIVAENISNPTVRETIGTAKVAAIEAARAKRVANQVGLNSAAEKLLAALASVREPKSWIEICVLAGLAHANGHFYGGRKCLVDNGLVDETAEGGVLITKAGLKLAGGARDALRFDQIMQTWCAKLRNPGGQMFQAIASARDFKLSKAQLAQQLNIKPDNGHWYGGVKAMRDAGLIEQEGDVFRATSIIRSAP